MKKSQHDGTEYLLILLSSTKLSKEKGELRMASELNDILKTSRALRPTAHFAS